MAPTAAMMGVAAPVALFLAGCNSGSDVTQNIAEIASGEKNLSTLVAALKATNLTSAVADTKDITVFAPTDDAFDALGEKTLNCLLEPVGLSTLERVLKYHVVKEEAKASDLSKDESLPTLDGNQTLTVMLEGDTVTIKGGATSANVTKADIMATNGVIHEVNAVLIPKDFTAPNCGTGSIADTAVSNADLKTLVTALGAAGLVDTFNGTDVFTVFAPTNDAFAALNESVPGVVDCLLESKNKDTLTQVLEYHVVAAYDLAADITDGLMVTTLESEKLTFAIENKEVMIETTSGGNATVVKADVYATNGVVHVINEVLIPANFKNPCSSNETMDDDAIMV